jgi:hypothetical protein
MIRRSSEAHSLVKQLIEHVRAQEGEPLAQAVAALRNAVEDHVTDEEHNILPALADKATPNNSTDSPHASSKPSRGSADPPTPNGASRPSCED